MKFIVEYSIAEQHALRNEICPNANDDQINYFLRVCDAKSVDPFSGLLYMQLRTSRGKTKAGVSPTIDGARAAAARTGSYAGSDEPEYDSDDAKNPRWCRVTVYRMVKDERCAFTAKVRWEEYKPSPPNDFQWNTKPYHMLGKCAEMLALRKGFPELASGAGEDDYEVESEDASAQLAQADQADKARLAVEWTNATKAFAELGKKEVDLLAYLGKVTNGVVTRDQFNLEHADMLRDWYDDLQREPPKAQR